MIRASTGASSFGAALEPPGVKAQRTLGRTGLLVSDIGFGSFNLAGDEALMRHALDRGISYFDTAEGYSEKRSKAAFGACAPIASMCTSITP